MTSKPAPSQPTSVSNRFLSVAEVAQLLGVSIHTIYGMIYGQRLPFRYHKFGRRVLIDRREFERWTAEGGIDRPDRPWNRS
jgi:excisionase family DNA binding protein